MNTINGRINIFFAITIIITFFSFLIMRGYIIADEDAEDLRRQLIIAESIKRIYSNKIDNSIYPFLEQSLYSVVNDNNVVLDYLSNGKELFKNNTNFGYIKCIFHKDIYYLYIYEYANAENYMFKSEYSHKKVVFKLYLALILTLFILMCLFLAIKKSLSPLKRLQLYIKAWSYNVETLDFKSNDEVGALVNEFNKLLSRIKELISSRQFFLRCIMHELKTPIAKGLLITELPYNDTKKQQLVGIFQKLNGLVNSFGKIEEVLSRNYVLNMSNYKYSELLDEAIRLMMLENKNNISTYIKEDKEISVDFDLFTIMLKNLIDNALKYSDDYKAQVEIYETMLVVKNKSEPLELNFSEYLKPFLRGSNLNHNEGFGLGLYLISYICEIHDFKLEYGYIDGYHNFRIMF